jgi:hypothetical protein
MTFYDALAVLLLGVLEPLDRRELDLRLLEFLLLFFSREDLSDFLN